jgi:hypothetical protein
VKSRLILTGGRPPAHSPFFLFRKNEVEAAAAYFSVLKPQSIMQVVETDMVPKTYVTGGHLAAMETGGIRLSRDSSMTSVT